MRFETNDPRKSRALRKGKRGNKTKKQGKLVAERVGGRDPKTRAESAQAVMSLEKNGPRKSRALRKGKGGKKMKKQDKLVAETIGEVGGGGEMGSTPSWTFLPFGFGPLIFGVATGFFV